MTGVAPELVGREQEQATVGAALDDARLGRARRLLLVGEPGIGKTALLDWAARCSAGMIVVRADGAETESDVSFAALLTLLRPLLELVALLPPLQRRALEGALSLGRASDERRFAVGAATLGVLAAAAEEQPVVVLLDDLQWVDVPSLEAIAFAVRRLDADAVCTVAATRPEGLSRLGPSTMEAIRLEALAEAHASALVLRARPSIAPAVRERLVAAAHGNPLALLELPGRLTDEQLAGIQPVAGDLPAGEAVQRAFAGSVAALPDRTRSALVVLALCGDDPVLRDVALGRLGLSGVDLEPAEGAGLVVVRSGRLWFGHPLARAAVVGATPAHEARRVHAAVAALLPEGERRASHLAAAAVGPDEEIAAELERTASGARARAAPAVAADLLVLAADLSPQPTETARRRLVAAESAWLAGLTELARSEADRILDESVDESLRAQALHLRGQIAHQTEQAGFARDLLLEAANHAEAAGDRAVPMLADAVASCMYAGDVEQALATAERLSSVARRDGGTEEFWSTLQLGTSLMLSGRGAEGAPLVHRAIELVQTVDVLRDDPRHLASAAMAPAWVDRPELGRALADRAIARARELGALSALPTSLKFRAWADYDLGHWDAALAGASEAVSIAREIGQRSQLCASLGIVARVLAVRGDEAGCRAAAEEAIDLAEELALPWHRSGFVGSLGLLELGLGRFEAAVGQFDEAVTLLERHGNLSAAESPVADRVEALVRAGRHETAAEQLARFARLAEAEGRDVGRAWAARLEGLVAPEESFEASFERSLALLGDVEPFERARTRLCLGERLRRSGERRRAREELLRAEELFERLGATPWAERCRVELRASGARLRREPEARDELTPQELQVALQVARGLTNREIAQTLFLSPKTVEFHLTRIYRKLGLHARAELVERYAGQVG